MDIGILILFQPLSNCESSIENYEILDTGKGFLQLSNKHYRSLRNKLKHDTEKDGF